MQHLRRGEVKMQVQKIFLITPLGNKYSDARKHADRMWNEVFSRLSAGRYILQDPSRGT